MRMLRRMSGNTFVDRIEDEYIQRKLNVAHV